MKDLPPKVHDQLNHITDLAMLLEVDSMSFARSEFIVSLLSSFFHSCAQLLACSISNRE